MSDCDCSAFLSRKLFLFLYQMCHLREFFIVHHLREKEDKKTEVVTIPKINSQQIVLDLSGQGQTYEQLVSFF